MIAAGRVLFRRTETRHRLPAAALARAAALLLLAGTAAGQGTWIRPEVMAPRERSLIGYDPLRQRTVVHGGMVGGTLVPETWEWDGMRWQLMGTSGPLVLAPNTGISDHLAWDPATGHLVMIATAASGTGVGMWDWDGAAWTQRPGVDPVGGSLVHSGGVVYRVQWVRNGCFGIGPDERYDVARWDAAAQAFVPSAAACARQVGGGRFVDYGGSLAFVSETAASTSGQIHLVVHGPTNPPWQPIGPPAGPLVAGSTAFVHDAGRGHLHAVSPWGPNHLRFDGATWSAVTMPPSMPAPLFANLAYDAARARTVLYGSTWNETWEFDGTGWIRRDAGPSLSQYLSMAHDAARGQTVAFGVTTPAGVPTDQSWVWRGKRWQREEPPIRPTPRLGPLMVYDRSRQTVVLHGGVDGNALLNDTWEWNGITWTDRSPPLAARPWARSDAAIAFHESAGTAILFGGRVNGTAIGDHWEWDGAAGTWTQRPTTGGPGAVVGHQMTYDAARDRTVLFDGGGARRDTWTWNGSTWARVNTIDGPWGNSRAMSYDRDRGVVTMFVTSVIGLTQWEFTGTDWQQVTASNVPGGGAAFVGACAYEEARRQFVTWTTETNPPRIGTWLHLPIPPGSYGTGCAGTGGLVPLLTANGRLDVAVQQGRPQAIAALGFGWQRASVPLLGCDLSIDPIWASAILLLDVAGAGSFSVALPPDLSGVLTLQAAVLDPGAPAGIALSNGFEARF